MVSNGVWWWVVRVGVGYLLIGFLVAIVGAILERRNPEAHKRDLARAKEWQREEEQGRRLLYGGFGSGLGLPLGLLIAGVTKVAQARREAKQRKNKTDPPAAT